MGVVALTAVVLVLLQLGHGAVDEMRAGSVARKHLTHRRTAAGVIRVNQRELTEAGAVAAVLKARYAVEPAGANARTSHK